MLDARPWLHGALAALLSDLPAVGPVLDWSAGMPYALSDLVGVEVELDPAASCAPASLHVRVTPAGAALLARADVVSLWPPEQREAPARVAAAVAAGLGRDEEGFVVDALPSGDLAPAALYAGVAADAPGATAARALALLGAERTTCALVDATPALTAASHVGIMPGRAGSPVRLVLADPGVDGAVWDALASLRGAPLPTLAAARAFARAETPGRRWYLDVDLLGDRLGPVVGIEVKRPADRLVPAGRLSVLRRWEGARYLGPDGAPAGPGEVAALVAGGHITRETRWLGHLKATFVDGRERGRKAYLGVARRTASRTAGAALDASAQGWEP